MKEKSSGRTEETEVVPSLDLYVNCITGLYKSQLETSAWQQILTLHGFGYGEACDTKQDLSAKPSRIGLHYFIVRA